jgi:hypothetical protein
VRLGALVLGILVIATTALLLHRRTATAPTSSGEPPETQTAVAEPAAAARPGPADARPATSASTPRPQLQAVRPPPPNQEQSVRALERAFARRSTRDANLFARFERAGVTAPPQAEELIRMDKAGATAPALEAFVRDAFPPDVRMRLVAVDWIHRRMPAAPPSPARPTPGAMRAPGWISTKRP